MKRHILITAGLALSLGLASCDSFLDQPLQGRYTSDNFFQNPTAAQEAVTGVYNALYTPRLWVFGDVASADAVKGGGDGDQGEINYIDDFSANAANGVINDYWQDTYEGIIRANNTIGSLEAMTNISDALKNRLVAECKFIRAYSYFNLVNVFGQVPLKIKPQNTYASTQVPLSSEADIYAQIEKDLQEAIPHLEVTYATEKGRATKGAAYGLLAKAQLYQEKYQDCLDNISLLEGLGQYDLLPQYADLFQNGAENSKESIFAFRYYFSADEKLGSPLWTYFAPNESGGYYFNAPTQSYVDIFTEQTIGLQDDPRLDASIGRDGKPWFNNLTFSSTWSTATGYLVRKYGQDQAPGQEISWTTVPYHYMRYADILMMKAEALNELGQVGAAATELDKVRNRAGLANTTATNQQNMGNAIRLERRKELGFEFHRFFDLMRWGQQVAEAELGLPFNGKWRAPRFYYPIPQGERDTNKAIK